MAHGLVSNNHKTTCKVDSGVVKTGVGSRRIFTPLFKLQVLDSYRNDSDCKGNQRATARKYGIHRRQIQKWLQVETTLRNCVRISPGDNPRISIRADLTTASRQRVVACDDEEDEERVSAPPHSPPPLDLSLKKPAHYTPSPSPPSQHHDPTTTTPPPPPPAASPTCLAWDLRKRPATPTAISPKPVKLFKPYLLEEPIKEPTPIQVPPCCQFQPITHDYQPSYTELQPYYPAYYDPLFKHRATYSLDFKLSAIDCYYQDAICRGNQRAVATKYNVHRRQVQKWLKQAEDLRTRNDSFKLNLGVV